eukprot:SAG25_NODE_323_length_9809_cov_4.314212_1_plen_45_part_00
MPEGTVLSISVRLAGDTNVGTVATRAIQGDRPIQFALATRNKSN